MILARASNYRAAIARPHRNSLILIITAIFLEFALPNIALAQCGGHWRNEFGVAPGLTTAFGGYVSILATWDPDGSGPLPPQLIAGGDIASTLANYTTNCNPDYIARWDGAAWQPIGTGFNGNVFALTNWTPSDPPNMPQLIAGGWFKKAGGTTVNGIARWDGAQWQSLGTGFSGGYWDGTIFALTTWDPDGDGPQTAQIVAAGGFTSAGGIAANNIARWDGSAWQSLGTIGLNNVVYELTAWDPDGEGPTAPLLVACGEFTMADGAIVNGIAHWNGATWQPFGAGMNGTVASVTVWLPDGPNQPGQLVAVGEFSQADGNIVNGVCFWDGSTWRPFGSGLAGSPFHVMSWDANGTEPPGSTLVACGDFSAAAWNPPCALARWDGFSWQPFASADPHLTTLGFALSNWDPDGAGPQSPKLIVGGEFRTIDGKSVGNIAQWDGTSWHGFGNGVNSEIGAATLWDPNGTGQSPPEIVAAGTFTSAGGVNANSVARWDGIDWHAFDSNNILFTYAMTSWRPAVGAPPLLIAGGSLTTLHNIAAWNGANWATVGAGFNDYVDALLAFNYGDAARSSDLIAGGPFTMSGGTAVNHIARWDGESWQSIGSGVDGPVRALTIWQSDDGAPQIIAAGQFATAGSVLVNNIARWDGSTWLPLGSGTNGGISAICTWDPDGPGPAKPLLVVAGGFTSAGGVSALNIAAWDGNRWFSLGAGITGPNLAIRSVTAFDPDGDGPVPPQLFAGGDFSTAGGVAAKNVARWDGAAWHPMDIGISNFVTALLPVPIGGRGDRPNSLLVVGSFALVGSDQFAGDVIVWDGDAILLDPQPAQLSICASDAITLTARAESLEPLTYLWRKDGVSLKNGAGTAGGNAIVSGVTTPSLELAGVSAADAGRFDCAVSNGCTTATSSGSQLAIGVCNCPGDLNGDARTDLLDVAKLLANFGETGALAYDGDLNGDTVIDLSDLAQLLILYGTTCP